MHEILKVTKKKIENCIKNLYITLIKKNLPRNPFKFILKILSGIGFLRAIGRVAQSLKALKYVVCLPYSVRGLGSLG